MLAQCFNLEGVAGVGATNGSETPVGRQHAIDRGFLRFAPSSPGHPSMTHFESMSGTVGRGDLVRLSSPIGIIGVTQKVTSRVEPNSHE